jgi:hypothetical protein
MSHIDSEEESETSSSEVTNKRCLYDYDQCIAALNGTKIPDDLSCTTARCAVVRGLRCSYDFAMNPDMIALCTSNPARYPELVRARNARLIMSNIVPDGLDGLEYNARPYCIWHPDIAGEDTYRQLAHRYPSMRYQVGRACAAAGYIDLYRELDLLPDISIAEEAREGDVNTEGGNKIYQLIMSSPLKYAVMDDFERFVHDDIDKTQGPAFLKGDTHVRWKLEWRITLGNDDKENDDEFGPHKIDMDIEEDQGLGLERSKPDRYRYDYLTPEEATLLWEPLPLDIPTLKKDLLRQMAAYEGNVDRYVRLSPDSRVQIVMHDIEHLCIIRGIYHNTMFARWWQQKLDTNTNLGRVYDKFDIQIAINARRVMINDIGTFTDDNPHLPWLIWYPLKPEASALSTLADRCPSMHEQILITSIFCDYQNLYQRLSASITPTAGLMEAAKQVGNTFYLEDLQKRSAELGVDPYKYSSVREFDDPDFAIDMEPTGLGIYPRLRADVMDVPFIPGFHRYKNAFGGYVERYVWLSFETIRKLDCQWGPDEHLLSNDLRYFETHELGKDEYGRDFIVETVHAEENSEND